MGKRSSKARKRKRQEDSDDEDLLAAAASAWAKDSSKQNVQQAKYPPSLPSSFRRPPQGFLCDVEPYREAFRVALNTAYEGCVWDGPDLERDRQMQHALTVLDAAGFFRTDVTQPAGLGAKCAPTLVTRCLLGEEGTTYKYLGLRMFAHPWNGRGQRKKVKAAVQTVGALNETLTERTRHHLAELQDQRSRRKLPEPVVRGRAGFNVALINKMTITKRLRDEPMFRQQKCAVSWHADSTLEHYSTIAVYHTITGQSTGDDEWSVALRVAHDAEGPHAKRLGDITVEDVPPLAIALPSGSTYYMLDDHNHHHQHAVLAPNASSTRFSSTHRLLRAGHTVADVLQRCAKVCANLDRHGPKRWRTEQILLNELETEWLRQFFVQGADNKSLLWGHWQVPMEQLFGYWEKLETRTRDVLLLLKQAAEARSSRPGRNADLMLHGQEALKVVDQVMAGRKSSADVFNGVASLLEERAKMRDLWAKREQDPAFARLPKGAQPLPFPVAYGSSSEADNCLGRSPLADGSPTFLKELATHVRAWGVAFETRSPASFSRPELL